jgi:uncharacterized protein DUF5655
MADEFVFTVRAAEAALATPISLAEAGLKERNHLQEWVIAHPQVLGPETKVITSEFGRWASRAGALERDRPDVLGLDPDGRLVVVELKRDRAPDTADMQALKYAALASRFTRDQLGRVYAEFLASRGKETVDAETATAELEEWADLSEESLRQPRVVLMARDFPATVTATVVYLHQQLGLDIRLIAFQAYRTAAGETLVTVSQHYPPPEIEDFVLSPEASAAKQTRIERQGARRDANTVARLLAADAIPAGERLEFRAPSSALQDEVKQWLDAEPGRSTATWTAEAGAPLQWDADGKSYSPTGLTRLILELGADRRSAVQGPLYWIDNNGQTLVELARELPSPSEVALEDVMAPLPNALRPMWEHLNEQLLKLGPEMTRRTRPKGLVYYAQRKLCDVSFHADHISVYLQTIDATAPDPTGLIVGGTTRYAHAPLRSIEDVNKLMSLAQTAYKHVSL